MGDKSFWSKDLQHFFEMHVCGVAHYPDSFRSDARSAVLSGWKALGQAPECMPERFRPPPCSSSHLNFMSKPG
jgi:hypothetical protein